MLRRSYGWRFVTMAADSRTSTGWANALRRALSPTLVLSAEQSRQFEEERVVFNRRRVLAILPGFILIQMVMIALYTVRVNGPAESFRQGIYWVHSTSLPMNLALWFAALWATRKKVSFSWIGDCGVILSIVTGMWLSLTTHRMFATNSSYTVALFATALTLRPTVWGALSGFVGSIAAFTILLPYVQPDGDVRVSFVSTAGTAAVISLLFSRVLHAAAVREFLQRLTIERQQEELRSWNADLEKRVETQVQEALLRKREARTLEAQLRMKVRARSQELMQAILEGVPDEETPAPGSRFEQRFVIERALGSGAMGDVFAGRDIETDQLVAIKLMRRWDGMSANDVGRFALEAAATAAVVHPAIVRTYHVDVTANGRIYLVMEFVRGQTLADALLRGHFDAAQTARFGAVAADALAVAHRAGVVHRDIKPSNMMLTTAAPGLRILDFGVSKLVAPGHGYQTVAGQIVGTPQYMAPEQILGTGDTTGAGDVYALGLVLHEMLRGKPTFSAKNMGDLLRAQMVDAPAVLHEEPGADIPENLSAIIAMCLEKDASERPSAQTLAATLQVIADEMHAGPLEEMGAPKIAHDTGAAIEVNAATIPAVNDAQ